MNRNFSRRIFSILLLLSIVSCSKVWTPYRPTVTFDSNWSDCREADTGGSVEWVSAFPPGEASLDSLWCSTVGGTLVEDHTDDTTAPTDSIAIITWNTHVGGGDIMRFIADLRADYPAVSRPGIKSPRNLRAPKVLAATFRDR